MTDSIGIGGQISDSSLSSFLFRNLTEYLITGELRIKPIPILPGASEKFWLSRSVFLNILLKEIDSINSRSLQPPIKILFGVTCDNIQTLSDGSVSVTPSGSDKQFSPSLLIGCDGVNSAVRRWLRVQTNSSLFDMNHLSSPSAGLRYKVLSTSLNLTNYYYHLCRC
jgi:flavin-dependent dehydrogenase